MKWLFFAECGCLQFKQSEKVQLVLITIVSFRVTKNHGWSRLNQLDALVPVQLLVESVEFKTYNLFRFP